MACLGSNPPPLGVNSQDESSRGDDAFRTRRLTILLLLPLSSSGALVAGLRYDALQTKTLVSTQPRLDVRFLQQRTYSALKRETREFVSELFASHRQAASQPMSEPEKKWSVTQSVPCLSRVRLTFRFWVELVHIHFPRPFIFVVFFERTTTMSIALHLWETVAAARQ